MKNLLFVTSALLFVECAFAASQTDRIQALRFDRGSVKMIHLAPGLGSILLFPCALSEVFVGRSEDLKAQISPNDKKSLFLNLKLNSSMPTNLIVRCEGERSVFVFDVIPSRALHQDVVEIRSSFGGPGVLNLKPTQSSKEKPSRNIIVLEKPTELKREEKSK